MVSIFLMSAWRFLISVRREGLNLKSSHLHQNATADLVFMYI